MIPDKNPLEPIGWLGVVKIAGDAMILVRDAVVAWESRGVRLATRPTPPSPPPR